MYGGGIRVTKLTSLIKSDLFPSTIKRVLPKAVTLLLQMCTPILSNIIACSSIVYYRLTLRVFWVRPSHFTISVIDTNPSIKNYRALNHNYFITNTVIYRKLYFYERDILENKVIYLIETLLRNF